MSRIQNFRNYFNQVIKRPNEQIRTLKLFIKTSKQNDSFGVVIRVYNFRQILYQDFRLLPPNEAESECRAYWAGYQLARSWTDVNIPHAKLYLAEDATARNAGQRRAA